MRSLQQPADLGSTLETVGVLKTRKFIKLSTFLNLLKCITLFVFNLPECLVMSEQKSLIIILEVECYSNFQPR